MPKRRAQFSPLFAPKAQPVEKTPAPAGCTPQFAPNVAHQLSLDAMFSLLRSNHVGQWMVSVSRATDEWHGNLSFNEAFDASQTGNWNAPAIKTVTVPELTGISDDMRYYNEVSGDQLDIASFCSGEPEYWQVAEPIQKPCGRVLRFAVEIGGLGDISADDLRNRGEAIIAMINSLELQGHSVEVSIVRAFTNSRGESYKFLIPIKNAGEGMDVRRLQFMLGHPAFYRRCLFGLAELAQGADMRTCGTRTLEYAPEGFIHISHRQGLGTSERAMAWAKDFAQAIPTIPQN
jgi:hypothetical protein